MSKPRYNWWSFALAMIRDYPARSKELKELRQQNVTADISGMPRGGGASRTTEGISLRQLPPQEQREYDAVHRAFEITNRSKEAKERLDMVRLTLWKGYTIPGAAMIVHIPDATARRYRWEFVLLVGCTYGLLTPDEYREALRKQRGK